VGEWGRKYRWIERIYACGALSTIPASSSARPLPSFFIVGPPRTGTTWLYEILQDHALLPSPTKETRFFDRHFHRGMDWYYGHYPRQIVGRRMGEVAPTYFASDDANERIARTFPGARVVCVFRNPVHRVLSLYRLKRAYGLIPWNFEEALLHDPEMRESSKYGTRLRAWQNTHGAEQILVMFYEDMCERPQAFIDKLADFIGVPKFALTDSQNVKVHASEVMTHPRSYQRTRSATTMADWFKARRLDGLVAAVRNSPLRTLFLGGGPPFPEVPTETVMALYRRFRAEVEELEVILNRDLSSWKQMSDTAVSRP